MSGKPPLLLHLGCGMSRMEGWTNCDLHATPFADVVFDVQQRWPFEDNQVREIYASHMLEHIGDFNAFFKEMWRVLEPNGNVCLRMPFGGHRLAWTDPTHLKAWYAESFCFLQPGYGEQIGNPQEIGWPAPYAVSEINLRVAAKFAPVLRWKLGRRLLLPWLENMENSVEEVWAWLFAIKTPEAIEEFKRTRRPYSVPTQYAMYGHHLSGKPLEGPEAKIELVRFAMNFDLAHTFK